jgi:hypothetical protein
MADRDPSRPDAYEQTGGGLLELLQRFKAAGTREELSCGSLLRRHSAARGRAWSRRLKRPTACWSVWFVSAWLHVPTRKMLTWKGTPELMTMSRSSEY